MTCSQSPNAEVCVNGTCQAICDTKTCPTGSVCIHSTGDCKTNDCTCTEPECTMQCPSNQVFDANAFSGRLEGGYRFVAPWVGGIGITPYAAAQFTTFDLPAYAEQALVGSNAFALAYNAKDVTDTRSELGLRADKSFAMRDGILTLRGRVAWAHDYDPNRSIASTFQSLPGASFVVNGAAQAANSALVTASIEKRWLSGWSAAATFEGEFSDVTRSYAGKGVVRYQW